MAERLVPAITRTVRFANKVGVVELLIVGVAFVFYYLVRGFVVERTFEATSRAIAISRHPCAPQVNVLSSGVFMAPTSTAVRVSSSINSRYPGVGTVALRSRFHAF